MFPVESTLDTDRYKCLPDALGCLHSTQVQVRYNLSFPSIIFPKNFLFAYFKNLADKNN